MVDKGEGLSAVLGAEGSLRSQSSVVNPIIIVELSTFVLVTDSTPEDVVDSDGNDATIPSGHEETALVNCDYAYIPELGRYYWITDISSVRSGLWQISMSCDVLMTYRDQIKQLFCMVERNENSYSALLEDPMVSYSQNLDVVEEEFGNNWSSEFDANSLNPTILVTYLGSVEDSQPTGDVPAGGSDYLNSIKRVSLPSTYLYTTVVLVGDESIAFFKWCMENSSAASFIVNMRIIPVPLGWLAVDAESQKLGSVAIGDKTYTASHNGLYKYRWNQTAQIEYTHSVPYSGIYTQYSPFTQYSIYLPFKGYVNVDSQLVVGKTLTVKYILGGMTNDSIVVYSTDSDENTFLVYSTECYIGVRIPLSTTNAESIRDQTYSATSSYILSTLGSVIGMGVGVATGNPLPVIAGIGAVTASTVKYTATMGAMHESANAQIVNGEASMFFPMKPVLRIAAKFPSSLPADSVEARKAVGAPLKQMETLSNLTGLTICSAVRTDQITGATLQERNEIERNLINGVIL